MGGLCSTPEGNPVTEEAGEAAPMVVPAATSAKGCTICIYSARGLRNADWSWVPAMVGGGVSDAYVIVKDKATGTELFKTKTIPNCLEPMWDEEFVTEIGAESILEFSMYDKDPLKPDDLLGKTELKAADCTSGFNGERLLDDAGKGIQAYLRLMVAPPGGSFPAGPPPEFKIILEKGTEKDYGFEKDATSPEWLFVTSLPDSGVVKDFNSKAKPEEQMKVGQYIVGINGVTDAKAMVKELEGPKVELSIVRPHCFTVPIKKTGPLGMTLSQSKLCNIVGAVNEGPVAEWNKTYPDKAVLSGDRIVAVNGNRTFGAEQMKLLKGEGNLQLVFSRRPPQTAMAAIKKGFFDWF